MSHQTSNVIEIVNMIGRGEIPSNEQISTELTQLKIHLAEKEGKTTTLAEEDLVRNLRKLVETFEKTIEKKNEGDKVKKLVEAAGRIAGKVDTFAARTAGNKLEQLTREFIGNLKDCVLVTVQSSEFRKLLLDFFILLKEVLVDIDEQVGASDKIKEGVIEGNPKEAVKELADKLGSVKHLPDDKKKEIRDKLKKLLNQLKEKSDSSFAFKKMIKIGSMINKELWDHLASDDLDKDVKDTIELATDLVQSFAEGQNINHFLGQLKKVVNFVHNNHKLQNYLKEWQDFIENTMEKEKLDDKFFDQAQVLFDKGRAILKTLQNNPLLNNVVDEATAIIEAIKNDEQLADLKYHAGKVVESLTYKDIKGDTHLNFDLIGTLRQEAIPFLMERIKEVPVPGFRIENKDFEYLEVTDLYVTLEDIVPDKLHIRARNNTELTMDNLKNPVKSDSDIKFHIDGIRPEFKDFSFHYRKKGWMSISDEGKANLKVAGSGVNIDIVFELALDSENRAMLGKHDVTVTVDSVVLELLDHGSMFTDIFVTLQDPVKYGLETALKKKIDDMGNEWAAYLNKKVLINVPSLNTITNQVSSTLNPLSSIGGALTNH